MEARRRGALPAGGVGAAATAAAVAAGGAAAGAYDSDEEVRAAAAAADAAAAGGRRDLDYDGNDNALGERESLMRTHRGTALVVGSTTVRPAADVGRGEQSPCTLLPRGAAHAQQSPAVGKQDVAPLPALDHDSIQYADFAKDFYK